MILILVRFMQIGRARESWQIYHKSLARFMDLPALACTSNLHEPHQNKNHSLSKRTPRALVPNQMMLRAKGKNEQKSKRILSL